MKFIDTFCGLGAFRIALENLGHECVFSCDIDQNVCEVYKNNFGNDPYCDITSVNAADLPDFDILCGGFPCQSFSIIGKKLGFNETRGTLFFDVARILKEKKPKYFILENVQGLLQHDDGKTFAIISDTLNEIGYTFKHKLLNSHDFGVPQNRPRVFLVGKHTGREYAYNIMTDFVFGEFEFPRPEKKRTKVKDILEDKVPKSFYLKQEALTRHKEMILRMYIPEDRNSWNSAYWKLVYSPTQQRVRTLLCSDHHLLGDKPFTVNFDEMDDIYNVKNNVRWFTPRELARLQGFPESYKPTTNRKHAYKQFGNSITVPVVQAIAKNLLGDET